MAAPTATARGTPEGIKLDDGYQSLITFERDTTIEIWEKTVGVPGLDGGDAIETTTMHNTTVRTMAARQLYTVTEFTVTAAYDPQAYDKLRQDHININQVMTRTFPDGSTLAFWAYVRTVEFADHEEGTQPEMTLTITPTNQDNDGVEQEPVLTEVAGT